MTTTTTNETPARIITLGVLAGAYKARNPKSLLTHSVKMDADGYTFGTFCARVDADSIADEYSASEEEHAEAPTCPTCRRRDPRFK